jgi:hypothetical protein
MVEPQRGQPGPESPNRTKIDPLSLVQVFV